MKLAPISGDLVVKLALGVVVIGAAWWAVSKVSGAAGQAVDAAAEWAENLASTTLNPASSDNFINKGVSAAGGALASSPDSAGMNADGSWSLGGWLHDVLNPDTAQAVRDMTRGGGASGSW